MIRVTAVSHIAGAPRDIANGVEHTVLPDPSKLSGVYVPDHSNGSGNGGWLCMLGFLDALANIKQVCVNRQLFGHSSQRCAGLGMSTGHQNGHSRAPPAVGLKPKAQILSIGTAQPANKLTPPEIISSLMSRSNEYLSETERRSVRVRLQAILQSTEVSEIRQALDPVRKRLY